MITQKQIFRFRDRIAPLLEVTVKAHPSHSKTGKVFMVKQHERTITTRLGDTVTLKPGAPTYDGMPRNEVHMGGNLIGYIWKGELKSQVFGSSRDKIAIGSKLDKGYWITDASNKKLRSLPTKSMDDAIQRIVNNNSLKSKIHPKMMNFSDPNPTDFKVFAKAQEKSYQDRIKARNEKKFRSGIRSAETSVRSAGKRYGYKTY